MTTTSFLERPDGRIGFDVAGEGPLMVLVPGMGDLRATYRFLAPGLVAAGYRVATVDLRGHGDSSTTFRSYGDVETASDIAALIEHLGGPAVVVGNSMGAGAAAYLAADRPELVSGIVLVGPFVRDGAVSGFQKLLMRIALAPAVAAMTWKTYLPKLYAGRRPDDLDAYVADVIASIKRPSYAKAFSATTHLSHTPVEARLGEVRAPVLVAMGELDPDFPSPADEAAWIAQQTGGEVVMVPDAGHYPQSQQPDVVLAAIRDFAVKAVQGA